MMTRIMKFPPTVTRRKHHLKRIQIMKTMDHLKNQMNKMTHQSKMIHQRKKNLLQIKNKIHHKAKNLQKKNLHEEEPPEEEPPEEEPPEEEPPKQEQQPPIIITNTVTAPSVSSPSSDEDDDDDDDENEGPTKFAFIDSFFTDQTAKGSVIAGTSSDSSATQDIPPVIKQEVGPGEGDSMLAIVLINRGFSDVTSIRASLDFPTGFSSNVTPKNIDNNTSLAQL